MKLRSIIIFIILVFSSYAMAAETLKDEAEVKQFTDNVMEEVGKGKLDSAFKVLRPYVYMNDIEFNSNRDEAMQLRQKYAMQYGPSKSYKFVHEKKIGDFVLGLQYLEIAEKQAIVWSFYFLKVDGIWKFDEFEYTPRLADLFQ